MAEQENRRDGEGFFSAWSRRKRAATKTEAAEVEAKVETVKESATQDAQREPADQDEPEISAEELAALPSIEEITGQTDLQQFMKRGVPKNLRNAAMRKVWQSNALIAGHDDPAVDYAWDWNAPEGVPGAGGILEGDRVSKMVDDLINQDRKDVAEHLDDQTDLAENADVSSDAEVASLRDLTPDERNHGGETEEADLPTGSEHREVPIASKHSAEEHGSEGTRGTTETVPRTALATPISVRRHGRATPE